MSDESKPATGEEWLTYKEVCGRLRIARSTLNVYIAAGRIPRPVHFSPRNVRWRAETLAEVLARGPAEAGTYSEDNVTDEARAQLRALTAELAPAAPVQAVPAATQEGTAAGALAHLDRAEGVCEQVVAEMAKHESVPEVSGALASPECTLPLERLCELHAPKPATPGSGRASTRRKKPSADELAADEARAKAREEEYLADLERRAAEVEALYEPAPEAPEPAPEATEPAPKKRKKLPAKAGTLPEEPAAAIDYCKHGHPKGFYCWLCEEKEGRELFERQRKAGEQPKPRRRKKQ